MRINKRQMSYGASMVTVTPMDFSFSEVVSNRKVLKTVHLNRITLGFIKKKKGMKKAREKQLDQ